MRALQAPVQEDHDVVVLGGGLRDGGEQPLLRLALGGGQAGLALARRPLRHEVVVHDVGGAEQGDALAVDLCDVGRVRLRVAPGADQRHGRGLAVREGVGQPVHAVVHAVVVGDGGHVHPGGVQGLQGGGGRAEHVRLVRGRGAALGDRGLQVDHGQVGGRELPCDRRERGPRVCQGRFEHALEHHVTSEGDGEGFRGPGLRAGRRGGRALAGGGGRVLGPVRSLVARGTGTGQEGEGQCRGADRGARAGARGYGLHACSRGAGETGHVLIIGTHITRFRLAFVAGGIRFPRSVTGDDHGCSRSYHRGAVTEPECWRCRRPVGFRVGARDQRFCRVCPVQGSVGPWSPWGRGSSRALVTNGTRVFRRSRSGSARPRRARPRLARTRRSRPRRQRFRWSRPPGGTAPRPDSVGFPLLSGFSPTKESFVHGRGNLA